jgi:ATP-binding cassette, subfamily B, bacterial
MKNSTPTPTATKLAIRHYFEQLWQNKYVSLPALLLPAIGNVFCNYLPPLVVAAAITHFGNNVPSLHEALPYLAWFSGLWVIGEILWRVGWIYLNRTDSRGIRNLYSSALTELAKKDIYALC